MKSKRAEEIVSKATTEEKLFTYLAEAEKQRERIIEALDIICRSLPEKEARWEA